MSLCRIAVFVLCLLLGQSLYAVEEIRFQVDIQGLHYQVVVTQNTRLESKVNGLDSLQSGQHYSGYIEGEHGRWVRASRVDAQWQGVVSIHNAMHVIQPRVAAIPEGSAASIMPEMNTRPVAQVEGMQGTCGRGDSAAQCWIICLKWRLVDLYHHHLLLLQSYLQHLLNSVVRRLTVSALLRNWKSRLI